jgi:hypothetical protein
MYTEGKFFALKGSSSVQLIYPILSLSVYVNDKRVAMLGIK